MTRKNKGWRGESRRHALASKGIKTTNNIKTSVSELPNYKYKYIGDNIGQVIQVYDDNGMKIGSINILTHEYDYATGFTPIEEKHMTIGIVDVATQYQGQGIGSNLIEKAIELQESNGLPLYLIASPPEKWVYEQEDKLDEWNILRIRLIKLYESYGFVIDETANDNIRMVRRL